MTPDGQDAEDRSTCTPCRGTGKLSSSLGGAPHEVTCPWCGGSGRFQSGRDAQAAGGHEQP
jgi:DnaJ-class molecular chaperone